MVGVGEIGEYQGWEESWQISTRAPLINFGRRGCLTRATSTQRPTSAVQNGGLCGEYFNQGRKGSKDLRWHGNSWWWNVQLPLVIHALAAKILRVGSSVNRAYIVSTKSGNSLNDLFQGEW